MGGLDEPSRPIVLDMALACLEFAEQFHCVALILDTVVAIMASHDLIEVIRRLCNVVLTLDSLKIDLELLNWVILSHLLDCQLKLEALVLKLVALNCLLNERDIRCKVVIKLCSNLTEGANDLLHEIRVRILHIKEPQKLMHYLSKMLAESGAPFHLIEHLDSHDVH